ncbi:RsmE family RNA methyltransferase [Mycolicibacterium setense]|uniref:RsmE family RNA methyltransferase n=1 Tax=Mycolicibacterium setense TaxID=431269 RepID=UPI000C7DE6DF|nr:RsmE family RNA methyltransferase [Mycolicibacterium setense]
MARDYYGLLGVSKGASDSEIKRAYRRLARELHPDVNPDAEAQARFTEIQVAYEVLSDPEKRRIVDMGGDPMESVGGAPGGFSGFGGLGDVFEAFFGGGTASRGPVGRVRPGADSLLRMRLDLEECATGVTKQVTVDTAVLCDLCHGKGTNGNSTPVTCDTCGGRGEIQTVQRSLLGARSAARQSRRAYVPAVDGVVSTPALTRRVADAVAGGAVVLALHESATEPFAELPLAQADSLMLIVGPEGGIADEEIAALTESGAKAVRLGPTVLRTSTAAAVALGAIGALTARWQI